jgi:uncharacterized protein YuzE
MDSARWQKVQTLFHEAVELPEPDRRGFLEAQCQDDPGLVGDVLVLLDEDGVAEIRCWTATLPKPLTSSSTNPTQHLFHSKSLAPIGLSAS